MAQQEEALAFKPHDLSLILGSHKMTIENWC